MFVELPMAKKKERRKSCEEGKKYFYGYKNLHNVLKHRERI
jgi:hypothetical protein